ncbi:MAG: ketoacyl-ACP synthase III [Candidatus Gastranaerophilales bacterium]|nr:ketoacyl-ACP synthase III [Candidatus Gastranaerophilales bacterium]
MTIPVMIAGVGYAVPDTVVTNEDLTKILETSDEWISTRTGIKERRICNGNEDATDLGITAAKKALEKAKMNGSEIELVIAAASVPTMAYPSTACQVQLAIGAKNAAGFDVTAACSGLLYAMNIAKAFIKAGTYKKILVVATDANSKFVDWTDRSTCVLFGDGAGAMVLKESEDGVDDIIQLDMFSEPECGKFIKMPITGHNCPLVEPNETRPQHIEMNGKEVYKFVVTKMPNYIVDCVEKSGLKPEDIDYLIPHQANVRIIDAMADRLGYDNNKVIVNIEKYGNTSAASIPIALVEGVSEGKIKLPCKAILTGFGAGMTCATSVVRLREGVA